MMQISCPVIYFSFGLISFCQTSLEEEDEERKKKTADANVNEMDLLNIYILNNPFSSLFYVRILEINRLGSHRPNDIQISQTVSLLASPSFEKKQKRTG